MPFIAESLFGNILHTENWQICKFSSFPNPSIYWNWQIEKFSLSQTLTTQWSCFAPILNCSITCNGSFDDAPLFSLLNDTNLIMKNETRTFIRDFAGIVLIQLRNLPRTKSLTYYRLKDKKEGYNLHHTQDRWERLRVIGQEWRPQEEFW